jgi:hypothetical protein
MYSFAITHIQVQGTAQTPVKWALDAFSRGMKQLELEAEQFSLPTSAKPSISIQ